MLPLALKVLWLVLSVLGQSPVPPSITPHSPAHPPARCSPPHRHRERLGRAHPLRARRRRSLGPRALLRRRHRPPRRLLPRCVPTPSSPPTRARPRSLPPPAGMIWRMDTHRMPHAFCVAQTALMSLSGHVLAGVCASFTAALYLSVHRPQRLQNTPSCVPYHPTRAPAFLSFPIRTTPARSPSRVRRRRAHT